MEINKQKEIFSPMLLIFFGNIGTGKSSVAKKVADELQYEFVHFDNIVWLALDRDKVYGENDEFLISIEETLKVYEIMHVIAKYLLQNKKGVVLESMYFKKQRDEAVQVAKSANVPYQLIEITCSEKEIKDRLEKRKKQDHQTPGFNLYTQFRNMMEGEDSQHITIDTTGKSVKESTNKLLSKLKIAA